MKNPSLQKTRDFLAFHEKRPEMRFWQALLAFENENDDKIWAIFKEREGDGSIDTFYLEP